jgi:transposase
LSGLRYWFRAVRARCAGQQFGDALSAGFLPAAFGMARCPELDTAAEHVRGFGEILTNRLGPTLPAWIDAVDASQLPGLTNFALHLHRDFDAVTAGLTLNWSSGGTEGAVNRIKKIKRQLYGRAGFELLRKMILLQ